MIMYQVRVVNYYNIILFYHFAFLCWLAQSCLLLMWQVLYLKVLMMIDWLIDWYASVVIRHNRSVYGAFLPSLGGTKV